ncbi:hypothetical protein QIS99_30085 [Streptomyces sp. B-S-A8]|uniref:Uncharacterized protein n=1 Tax=Streptomyces solicavernae TaxID=3043614 RepID=A0ABT6S140_9ACTN|nr:hypothetical protein [Streptomyces sp. B-S-A8]MDI3390410.1 hypothetical protein [Streptomyces sp. B-S-A8]
MVTGAVVTGRGNGKDLAVDSVDLETFKKRIDLLLERLNGSPAQHNKIGEQTITNASFGTGFAAADDLAKGYEKVRSRLERLSRIFGEQIEGMGIVVQISGKGYDSVDAEQAERYQAIRQRAEKYYQEPATATDHGTDAPAQDTSSGADGATSGTFS